MFDLTSHSKYLIYFSSLELELEIAFNMHIQMKLL